MMSFAKNKTKAMIHSIDLWRYKWCYSPRINEIYLGLCLSRDSEEQTHFHQ